MNDNSKTDDGIVLKMILYVLILLIIVVILFPYYWVLTTSLKSNKDFYMNIWGFPRELVFDNYLRAWTIGKIGRSFFNSVIVTGTSMVFTVIFAATTGYVFARYNFPFKKLVWRIYISSMMLPAILALIPQFLLLMNIGMLGTRIGLIFVYSLGYVPFCQFVLYGFYKTLPKELEEAGRIDGAGYFQTFYKIMLPLVKPAIMTVLILSFISFWNEYIDALVFLSSVPDKYTLPVGLAGLLQQSRYRTEWGPLMAGNVILLVPTIIIYGVFNSMIMSGLTVGAVKG